MSAEADFRALLAGHAGLAALVGTRIAQNAVPRADVLPLVVFVASHVPEHGLDGTLLADQVTFAVQCWGKTAADAAAVAAQVKAACATAPAAAGCTVTAQRGSFDAEMGLDGEELDVEWWT